MRLWDGGNWRSKWDKLAKSDPGSVPAHTASLQKVFLCSIVNCSCHTFVLNHERLLSHYLGNECYELVLFEYKLRGWKKIPNWDCSFLIRQPPSYPWQFSTPLIIPNQVLDVIKCRYFHTLTISSEFRMFTAAARCDVLQKSLLG